MQVHNQGDQEWRKKLVHRFRNAKTKSHDALPSLRPMILERLLPLPPNFAICQTGSTLSRGVVLILYLVSLRANTH